LLVLDAVINQETTMPWFNSCCVPIPSIIFQNKSFEEMIELGFEPKYNLKAEWPQEDTAKLLEACSNFYQDKLAPTQRNWYYYIASEVFHNAKSAKHIEAKINQILRGNS
jgi:hypothetical protein